MVEIQVTEIIIGGVSGAIYGGSAYLKKRQQGEAFDGPKFGGSVIIGAAVGIGIANMGLTVTENYIGDAILMGATMGFTALIENGLRYLWRAATGTS